MKNKKRSFIRWKNIRYKKTKITILIVALIVVLVFIVAAIGKNHLFGNKKDSIPKVESGDGEVSTDSDGIVSYKGAKYKPKENITTILFMGIDNNNGYKITNSSGKGQADCIMLAVLDMDENQMKLIAIPRDLMTNIAMYGADGKYVHDYTGQICLQYAYGDGKDMSCELMTEAVSQLLYGIPVDTYCALKMSAISKANDLIGGVWVEVPDEQSFCKKYGYTPGDYILLKGKNADNFLRYRDNKSGSSLQRLSRQKIYLNALVTNGVLATKSDITLPIKLYNKLSGDMYTNFSVDKMTYLATVITGLQFSESNIYTIDGEMKEGKEFDEYYPTEQELYELVLDVFYTKM